MTQQETLEYNKRCAEFLGKGKSGSDVTWTFPSYLNGNLWVDEHFFNNTDEYCGRRQTKVSELKFHSDWNWIMEVVARIQLLDIVHDNTRSYDAVYKEWQCTFSPTYKTHDFGYIVGKSKNSEKEAVVQAINQFLIWYNTTSN